jgi:DNA replication and repair protein RecF
MVIKSLSVVNFRNHQKSALELVAGCNIFVGGNAQGKTNLLEAIYFTCVGRTFRTARDREVIRFGSDFAKITTKAEKKFGGVTVEILISAVAGRAGKQIKINGIPIAKMGELIGSVQCVFFNPDELRLVKDAPADRRRFLDIDISQIDKGYFYNLLKYNRILKQRNALLKEFMGGESEMRGLDIWDEQLAGVGADIVGRRVLFCEELKKGVESVHKIIAPTETIAVELETLGSRTTGSVSGGGITPITADGFLQILRAARKNDLRLKTTTVGPHRDDLLITIGGKDVRDFASQGQQRTAALSLKLAELEIFERASGEKPILLLDDIFSELDAERQGRIVKFISNWQSIITTAENVTISGAKVFAVRDGTVKAQHQSC